mgnify:CR=1 FL=1|tara:strand:- start:44494 stop:46194 length:1701 start_codon:yes stop_codon:yes gene_type:complete
MLRNIIAFMLISLAGLATTYASVTATLDRNTIAMGESVNLTIQTDSTPDAQPQLTGLQKNFQVIGNSNSSQISIINGKQTRNEKWTISLMPKKAGTFVIPAIQLGKQSTKPITIIVKPATKLPLHGKIFLEATVNPKQPYVGGQAEYIVKLFYAVDGLSGSLLNPDIPGARVLGNDVSYQIKRYGKIYNVLERHYVFFPQKAGQLTIPGIIFSGQVPESHANSRSMDQLFQMTGGKPMQLAARPIDVTVAARPANINETDWLPAQSVMLKQYWNGETKAIHVGDPITRTIEVRAVGLPGNRIYSLTLPTVDNANAYPSQAKVNTVTDGNNIIGSRTEKIAYIPTKPGKFILPAVSLHWFNTLTGKAETATLKAKSFTILPALPGSTVTPPPLKPGLTPKPMVTPLMPLQPAEEHDNHDDWLWGLIIAFAIAWLFTMFLWWQSRRRRQNKMTEEAEPASQVMTLKQARQAVRNACNCNDAKQLESALLTWAKRYWPRKKIRNIHDINSSAIHPDLHQAIETLMTALYKQGVNKCDGHHFWLAFIENEKHQIQQNVKVDDDLPPLHPK